MPLYIDIFKSRDGVLVSEKDCFVNGNDLVQISDASMHSNFLKLQWMINLAIQLVNDTKRRNSNSKRYYRLDLVWWILYSSETLSNSSDSRNRTNQSRLLTLNAFPDTN